VGNVSGAVSSCNTTLINQQENKRMSFSISKSLILAAAATAITAPAMAAEGDWRAGITAGALGIGPEVSWRPSDHFGVRASGTFLSLNQSIDDGDTDYTGKLKLNSWGLMADVYPFGGSFFVSAGVRINGNEVSAKATPTSDIDIGDGSYTPQQVGTLTGRLDTRSIAPQATLGWSGGRKRGFNFGFEAGVLFQGALRAAPLTYTGTVGSVSAADLERERQNLQEDVDGLKIWPVVQLRLGYRF
jgi:hypothetical protein